MGLCSVGLALKGQVTGGEKAAFFGPILDDGDSEVSLSFGTLEILGVV
jgi:hypothetical protein